MSFAAASLLRLQRSLQRHQQRSERAGHSPTFNALSTEIIANTSTFPLLSLLPPPLLAFVASNLSSASLLRLQRCSWTHYRLRSNDAYMSVAWRWAELRLCTTSLYDWTVPFERCIEDFVHRPKRLIPVNVWRAAVAAFQAVLDKADRAEERYQRLLGLVSQPQPTKWVSATPDEYGWWNILGDEAGEQSANARRVEVLADIDWYGMEQQAPTHVEVVVRCRLVLQACPYLQHFLLGIDARSDVELSQDTFALIPRLRSLYLSVYNRSGVASNQRTGTLSVDFEDMLNSMSHLTSLRCTGAHHFGISEVLEIASHSTLDDVHVFSDGAPLADEEWIGAEMSFPVSVETDEIQLEEDTVRMVLEGDIEAECDETADASSIDHKESATSEQLAGGDIVTAEQEPAWVRDEMHRINKALTRTEPTQRSCEVRLALADWLHRRLRRGKLRTDDHSTNATHPKWLLRSCRKHVALLRSTLRQQLSELKEATLSAVQRSETNQLNRLKRLEEELGRSKNLYASASDHLQQCGRWHTHQRLLKPKLGMIERGILVAGVERSMEVYKHDMMMAERRIDWLEGQRNALHVSVERSKPSKRGRMQQ